MCLVQGVKPHVMLRLNGLNEETNDNKFRYENESNVDKTQIMISPKWTRTFDETNHNETQGKN